MGLVDLQPDPIPARVRLQWTTPDGVRHNRLVEVAARIADIAAFTGVIWIEFVDVSDDGFRVVVVPGLPNPSVANEKF